MIPLDKQRAMDKVIGTGKAGGGSIKAEPRSKISIVLRW